MLEKFACNISELADVFRIKRQYAHINCSPRNKDIIEFYDVSFILKSESAFFKVLPHFCSSIVLVINKNSFNAILFGPGKSVTQAGGYIEDSLYVIINFTPVGLYMLTGKSQESFADLKAPLQDVLPSLYDMLLDAVQSSPSLNVFIKRVDDALFIYRSISDNPALISNLINKSITHFGDVCVKTMAMDCGYSQRHLSRLFMRYTGLSPKFTSRLIRINKAVETLKKAGINNTEAILYGYEFNYFDQSHFIHDFQDICGISPKKFASDMSVFYNHPITAYDIL